MGSFTKNGFLPRMKLEKNGRKGRGMKKIHHFKANLEGVSQTRALLSVMKSLAPLELTIPKFYFQG